MLVIMVMEQVSNALYPLPINVDPTDYHQLAAYMKHVAVGKLMIVYAGWILGSFVCGILIGIITRDTSKGSSIIAGALLLCTGIVNLFLYPHPDWFRILAVLSFIPFTYLGHIIANQLSPTKTKVY